MHLALHGHCATTAPLGDRAVTKGTQGTTVRGNAAPDFTATRGEMVELIPALRAFARTFCKNPTDADDLVQETLSRALSHIDQYTEGTKLKSWLFTIMRNAFLTSIKRSNRESPGADDCVANRPFKNASQEWSMAMREVEKAIDRLPRANHQVLVLIGVLGVSYEEAAEICGCAVGTIKSRLSRARQMLLEDVGERSSGELLTSRSQALV